MGAVVTRKCYDETARGGHRANGGNFDRGLRAFYKDADSGYQAAAAEMGISAQASRTWVYRLTLVILRDRYVPRSRRLFRHQIRLMRKSGLMSVLSS